jgi:hypothetical protein
VFAQLKYSSRIHLDQRLLALVINVVVNLFFIVGGSIGALPEGWLVTGVVFSAIGLTALFVVCVTADVETIKSLFSTPNAYNTMLAPVPAWKNILSRVICMTALDLIMLTVGIIGVVIQAGGMEYGSVDYGVDIVSVLLSVVGYIMMFLIIIFACAVAKGPLYHLKGRGILGVGAALIVMYAGSWMALLLTPFARVHHEGMFFMVDLAMGWNAGTIAYIVLLVVEAAALLIGASYLYERKVNI